jgi:hypothetical protein
VVLERLARVYRERPAQLLAGCTMLAFALRVACAPFGAPLNLDAFAYLLKAREIVDGLWVPIRTHAIGWSVFLAPAIWFGDRWPTPAQIALVRIVASAVGALTLVPVYLIARTVDDVTGTIAIVLCVFAIQSIHVAVRGLSEPLHTLLLVSAVAVALDAGTRTTAAIVAGICSGLAAAVHPTGLLVAVLALGVIAGNTGRRLRGAAIMTAAAIAVAAPAAVQRQQAFGTPLSYGENNRLFADSPADMWNPHQPVQTAAGFVRNHTASAMLRWLIVDGLFAELRDLAQKGLTLPVVPFAIWGAWIAIGFRGGRLLLTAAALFLGAWILPYPVLGASRHLAPVLPMLLVVVSLGLARLQRAGHRRWATALVVVFAVGHTTAAFVERYQLLHDETVDGREWGAWVASHVRGRLAVIEGQELIMMHLPDARIGGADITTIYAPHSGLSLVRPGSFATLDGAMRWLRDQGTTHVLVDYRNPSPSYFEALRSSRPAFLDDVYASPDGSQWPVRIYRIDWDRTTLGRSP